MAFQVSASKTVHLRGCLTLTLNDPIEMTDNETTHVRVATSERVIENFPALREGIKKPIRQRLNVSNFGDIEIVTVRFHLCKLILFTTPRFPGTSNTDKSLVPISVPKRLVISVPHLRK